MINPRRTTHFVASSNRIIYIHELAGVALWTQHRPVNQKVASSIPSQGTCLGSGQVPSWGCVRGTQSMFLSLPPSLPLL